MDSFQPTILIVDDEKHTRDGLQRLLENDYDVYVAPDIAGANNVIECESVDLLLTDLRLANEDGMILINQARDRCLDRPLACQSLYHLIGAVSPSLAAAIRRYGFLLQGIWRSADS
jgi:DNA-binding NtrC family response regulator